MSQNQKPSAKLGDLVQIDEVKRPSAYEVGKYWVTFLVEPRRWPNPFRLTWHTRVRLIPADINRIKPLKSRGTYHVEAPRHEMVCLCEDTRGCNYKGEEEIANPHCPRYIAGICVDATRQANEEPLLLDTVGIMFNTSKQRIDQIYDQAIVNLVREIHADPILRQHCLDLGFKLRGKQT